MKAKVISSVQQVLETGFVVPMVIDSGSHARTVELPILLSNLAPRCDNYVATTVTPYRINWTFPGISHWIYRGKVVAVEVDPSMSDEEQKLEVMHAVARRDRRYDRMRKMLQNYELMGRAEQARREAIPESVRIFVWQRDQGKCVKCGSQARLEFDHIIPVSKGGSSTERNIQLLCETCNREKGATV